MYIHIYIYVYIYTHACSLASPRYPDQWIPDPGVYTGAGEEIRII